MNLHQQFEAILREHGSRTRRICGGYADSIVAADDLFQEVCLQVWKALPRFRAEASLPTWLYRITVNTCLMHVRQRQRLPEVSLTTQELPDEPPSGLEEQVSLLYRFMSQLADDERLLLLLYLENLSYHQIAETLGITANHVGVRLSRLRKILALKFHSYDRV